jgi:hypothetical protein
VGGTTAATFTDLDLNLSAAIGACPAVIPNGYFGVTPFTAALKSGSVNVGATQINAVLPSSNSRVAFVTYTGTGGLLPYYSIPATGLGTLGYLQLSGSATAPLAGVFTSDNATFYVGTAGDNAIHQIGITYPATGVPTVVDSATPLMPNLPAISGTGNATVNLLVQYTKKSPL